MLRVFNNAARYVDQGGNKVIIFLNCLEILSSFLNTLILRYKVVLFFFTYWVDVNREIK